MNTNRYHKMAPELNQVCRTSNISFIYKYQTNNAWWGICLLFQTITIETISKRTDTETCGNGIGGKYRIMFLPSEFSVIFVYVAVFTCNYIKKVLRHLYLKQCLIKICYKSKKLLGYVITVILVLAIKYMIPNSTHTIGWNILSEYTTLSVTVHYTLVFSQFSWYYYHMVVLGGTGMPIRFIG